MKLFVILLLLAGGGYYVYANHSPFQTTLTEPYFVEIRINYDNSDIKLVGFGKMLSREDCHARAALMWVNALKHIGEIDVGTECKKAISEKYQRTFENEIISASYIAFDKGEPGERDARFVIYGVPSSLVIKECSKITQKARERYTGEIYCIQGTVG